MKNKLKKSKSELKSEIIGIVVGLGFILFSLSCGLFFVPKAYASQSIINRKGAQVMEYMDISIFCAIGIILGAIVLILSIRNLRN